MSGFAPALLAFDLCLSMLNFVKSDTACASQFDWGTEIEEYCSCLLLSCCQTELGVRTDSGEKIRREESCPAASYMHSPTTRTTWRGWRYLRSMRRINKTLFVSRQVKKSLEIHTKKCWTDLAVAILKASLSCHRIRSNAGELGVSIHHAGHIIPVGCFAMSSWVMMQNNSTPWYCL